MSFISDLLFIIISQIDRRSSLARSLSTNCPKRHFEKLSRSEIVKILRDQSLNDPDEQLRQFAQYKLAEWEGK
jgi:hypothetical protein